jgi:hypothetical protein
MNLKRAARNLLIMETRERGSLKEMERKMLQSRKTERNSDVNIVQRMAMKNTIVGKFILKRDPKSSTTKRNQTLLQLYNKIGFDSEDKKNHSHGFTR